MISLATLINLVITFEYISYIGITTATVSHFQLWVYAICFEMFVSSFIAFFNLIFSFGEKKNTQNIKTVIVHYGQKLESVLAHVGQWISIPQLTVMCHQYLKRIPCWFPCLVNYFYMIIKSLPFTLSPFACSWVLAENRNCLNLLCLWLHCFYSVCKLCSVWAAASSSFVHPKQILAKWPGPQMDSFFPVVSPRPLPAPMQMSMAVTLQAELLGWLCCACPSRESGAGGGAQWGVLRSSFGSWGELAETTLLLLPMHLGVSKNLHCTEAVWLARTLA